MFYKLIAVVIGTVVSLGALNAAAADAAATEQTLAPATLVIYRAQESLKSERVSMKIIADGTSLGRLKSDKTIVKTVAAGQYQLGTSVAGTQSLDIDLKPGSVHYVKTEIAVRGSTVKVSLVEVEEQVAKIQNPTLNGAI